MDDNNQKPEENQTIETPVPETPQAETHTEAPVIEDAPIVENVPMSSEVPVEEVAADVTTPEEAGTPSPEQNINPPVYEENKNQYLIFMVAGIVVFIIFLIIIIKAIFGGLAGKAKVTLTYWGLWEDKAIMAPLISAYQQKYPNVTINYQQMTPDSFREKLIARSKAKQGPDIFRFHNTWLPEISEIVTPIPNTIMSNSEFEKTFYPIAQKDLKAGNYYYGIPLEIDGLVLVYNNSLFKKAGIQTSPSTWDDITEIVPKLTVKDLNGNLITSGIAIGTSSNIENFSDIFGLLLAQNGGSLSKLEGAEAAGALEIYRKFAEAPQGYWNDQMSSAATSFTQEKVAMIIVPSWEILSIKAANPDIDLKVVSVPAVPGAAPVSLASYWVEGVSRFSQNQIEAWKFLKYLSEKDNETKLYESQAKVRLFGEPYSRVDLGPLLLQNQYVGPVIKQANDYVSMPLISRTYDNGLNDEIIKYIENAINATTQGVTYSEALTTAKSGVTQIFTKYNISN